MTNNNRSEILQQSEISLDTGCLLCALCQPAQPPRTFADVQLSWHCAFRGTLQFLQLLASFRLCCVSRNRHHVRFQALKSYDTLTLHIVFLHFLRLPPSFSLGFVSHHIQPVFIALFCRIRFIYCRLDDCRSRNFGLKCLSVTKPGGYRNEVSFYPLQAIIPVNILTGDTCS